MSSSEWKVTKLGDIATIVDCEHKTAPIIDGGDFISVRTANISNGRIDFDGCNRVSHETFESWTKRIKPKGGDIILAREAPVGEVGWVPDDKKVCLGQRTVLIRVHDKSIDAKYLLYYLTNKEAKQDLVNRSSGSVVAHLNVKDIRNLDLKLTNSHSEQTRIASILSSLDDKIELNRQTNQTLEAIAQTLFKEMCVPKGDELPEGWEVVKLGELIEIKYGKDHKHLAEGEIPVYGSGGIMRYANKAIYEKDSILIPRKGSLNNLFYLTKPFWTVDTMFYTKIHIDYCGKFLFYFLKSLNLASMNVGSAVPSMTTAVLNELAVLLPTNETLKEFDSLVSVFFEAIEANIEENQTLTALRDSLLPKLMKGEIEVSIVQDEVLTN